MNGPGRNGPVVVGVDGSKASAEALRWAADEARRRAAPLKVVMAWHYPHLMWMAPTGMPSAGIPPASELTRYAAERVDEMLAAEGLAGGGAPTIDVVVAEGPAAEVVLGACSDADLLVVGSRGNGAFAGMLLGSVSQHCISHAPCPVVVVPPEE